MFRYREKPLQQKFDILFQRNLFVLAIQIAQKTGVDPSQQNMIFRKYGDYLYQKKDYDTAMQQYLRAIDDTEPSQIIRKVVRIFPRKDADQLMPCSILTRNVYTTSSTTLRSFMINIKQPLITLSCF